MPRRKTVVEAPVLPVPEAAREASIVSRTKPLVFISHDSRDADLAEAFDNLLTDASGGMLKSFRSSDRKGTAGIEFGREWYTTIMDRLGTATDVVALLTQNSVDRPWILYEAGVAKGKLNTIVFGVAMGIPLERANTGPFAQFQNSSDDEDSLTKLVSELTKRNQPDATPREEAVRRQVTAFREQMGGVLKTRPKSVVVSTQEKTDETAIAKLFEEVKVIVRDLPISIEERLGSPKLQRFHPMMMEEMLFSSRSETAGGKAIPWLMFISMFRDDFPWIYEIGVDLYKGLRSGDPRAISQARCDLKQASELVRKNPMIEEMFMRSARGRDVEMLLFELPQMLDHFLSRLRPNLKAETDKE